MRKLAICAQTLNEKSLNKFILKVNICEEMFFFSIVLCLSSENKERIKFYFDKFFKSSVFLHKKAQQTLNLGWN